MSAGGFVLDYRSQGAAPPFAPAVGFLGVGGCLVALLLWSVAAWSWQSRYTPLVIDTTSGEIRYGRKVLCRPGAVKAVRLHCSHLDAADDTCSFDFVLSDNGVKALPSPFFASMNAGVAADLAETVAALLKVSVLPE